jgi:hypothetical protein
MIFFCEKSPPFCFLCAPADSGEETSLRTRCPKAS